MPTDPLPLPSERDASGRSLGAEELALLGEVIESGILFGPNGTKVKQFEKETAELLGVPHVRAVSSGSAAVHVALGALDLAPGGEVVTTPITDIGGIAPILFQGAVPVFADVDAETLNVTADTIAERLTERTAAIIVTHLFGNPCDMDPILALAGERGLPVVEDAAQAILARYHGRLAGTMGTMAAFSLQQTKHMTCGEGGFVVTESDALAYRARVWADKGWNYAPVDPDHEFLGLNYRMSELQGAVALAQLRKVEEMVERRVRTAEDLSRRLEEVPGVRALPTTHGARPTYWRFVLQIDHQVLGMDAAGFGAELKSLGIWNVPNYIRVPAFLCAQFQQRRTFGDTEWPYSEAPGRYPVERLEDYPGCRRGLESIVVLPWTERHEERHVEFIARAVAEAVERILHGDAVGEAR